MADMKKNLSTSYHNFSFIDSDFILGRFALYIDHILPYNVSFLMRKERYEIVW
jgi:hypothetical protein